MRKTIGCCAPCSEIEKLKNIGSWYKHIVQKKDYVLKHLKIDIQPEHEWV